jgi:hypothetical protein
MRNAIPIVPAEKQGDQTDGKSSIFRNVLRGTQITMETMFARMEIIAIVSIWGASVLVGILTFTRMN